MLGKNILTLPWIPQNDLLAHPATRLFITHCGISSTYEAAIHGVPVVAIPLNLDQPANAEKLVNRCVCFLITTECNICQYNADADVAAAAWCG